MDREEKLIVKHNGFGISVYLRWWFDYISTSLADPGALCLTPLLTLGLATYLPSAVPEPLLYLILDSLANFDFGCARRIHARSSQAAA